MCRPTRTRRLSIAAIVSLLAFVVVAAAGIRSFWTWDAWGFKSGVGIAVDGGHALYLQPPEATIEGGLRHFSGNAHTNSSMPGSILGFFFSADLDHGADGERTFALQVPVWFPLLLLLLAPTRWLIARPANTPAFQVVAKQP